MTTGSVQPPAAVDDQLEVRSTLAGALHVAFIAMVTVGALTVTGLVFWLLSLLANSSYGLYFGI